MESMDMLYIFLTWMDQRQGPLVVASVIHLLSETMVSSFTVQPSSQLLYLTDRVNSNWTVTNIPSREGSPLLIVQKITPN